MPGPWQRHQGLNGLNDLNEGSKCLSIVNSVSGRKMRMNFAMNPTSNLQISHLDQALQCYGGKLRLFWLTAAIPWQNLIKPSTNYYTKELGHRKHHGTLGELCWPEFEPELHHLLANMCKSKSVTSIQTQVIFIIVFYCKEYRPAAMWRSLGYERICATVE